MSEGSFGRRCGKKHVILVEAKNAGQPTVHDAMRRVFCRFSFPPMQTNSPGIGQRQKQEKNAGQTILNYIVSLDLPVEGSQVKFDSASATVMLSGKASDQQTREKVILCAGNVQGVERVDNQLEVAE